MALVRPIGAAEAAARLLPLIQLLLDDANTNVRLSIIYHFAELLDVVGVDVAIDSVPGGLVEVLCTLGDDETWRVRHAIVLLLPTLASLMDAADFAATFNLERFLIDSCALVRLDTIKTCVSIAQLPGYSQPWIESTVLPLLRARVTEVHSYQRRALVLEGLGELAAHMSQATLEEGLLPLALNMAIDRVPNLRLDLAKALQRAAPRLSAATLAGRVFPVLERLLRDEDIDVADAAAAAADVAKASLHEITCGR